MQVSAYQFLDIVRECLADAGTASDPPSKLRRVWQPQALALPAQGAGPPDRIEEIHVASPSPALRKQGRGLGMGLCIKNVCG